MQSIHSLPKPFFVLAPMDDVTDTVFRRIVAECAPPDLYFTEFVNVDGLQSPGKQKLLKKLQFTTSERPLIAQLWGKTPENYYLTAKELVGQGYAGIDINMGCPDKTVVKNGCCAALINNRELAAEIIAATKRGIEDGLTDLNRGEKGSREGVRSIDDFPLSVKTRIGLSTVDLTWIEFLLTQKLNMLTIHGRTAKQMSAVPADWDIIGQIATMRTSLSPNTKIVGNGDVLTRAQGLELARRHGLDGIMIGRGVFQDPFVFADKSPWAGFTREQRIALFRKHVELFAETWQHHERAIHTLNKFCKIYINGFEGAKEMREKLMSCKTASELRAHLT